MLWETEQPYIDNLSRTARAFGHQIKQRFFLNEKALGWENLRIWQTYYEPKPLSQLYTGWQEMLEEHRQIIVQVQEIAEEAGWRGPETPMRLEWKRCCESVI